MNKNEAVKQLMSQGIIPTESTISALVQGVREERQSKYEKIESAVKVLKTFDYTPKKIKVDDFTEYFRNRYNVLKSLLFNRPQMASAVSISQAKSNPSTGEVVIIAMVAYMSTMPNNGLRLTLEDLSASTNAYIFPKNDLDSELVDAIQMLTLDEVVGFVGSFSKGNFYINKIIWPDIPSKQPARTEEEVYAIFSGDIHVGSNNFLGKDFQKFMDWFAGNIGNDKQKEIARRTKYFFIPGDLVDGIGIYPGQNRELVIDDINAQYDALAKMLKKVPEDKHIIVCPGNHDAVRLEEPQPQLYKQYAAPIYELPNVTMLTNPAYANIHGVGEQLGFDVLQYHGYSFDTFIDRVEGLRLAGGYDRADLIHQFLLKRRHLSPTHNFNLTLPIKNDPLIIQQVPDILVSGHIHKARIGAYKSTLSFSGSCWQSITEFQKKVGHSPDPGFVPLLNLKTRKSTMLRFT